MTQATAYSMRRHATAGDIAALRAEWNALAADVPFASYEWLETWWRVYAPPAWRTHLAIVSVRDARQQLVGLAPWYLAHTGFGAELRFLGTGEVCSEYIGVLARPGCERAVGAALGHWLVGAHGPPATADSRALASDPPPRWNALAASGIPRGSAAMAAMVDVLAGGHCLVHRRPGLRCWSIPLPATWAEYRNLLSKSHRKQLARLDRRYFATGRARLFEATTPADVERGLDILAELHNRRRRSLGDAGRFRSPRFVAFHRELADRFLATGQLRLYWLEVDARPVAAEYQFRGRRAVFAYQSGIEPATLELEPGRLITMATLRRAIDERAAEYDLLRGDEPYKSHWRAAPRELDEIWVLRSSWVNRCRLLALSATTALKQWHDRPLALAPHQNSAAEPGDLAARLPDSDGFATPGGEPAPAGLPGNLAASDITACESLP